MECYFTRFFLEDLKEEEAIGEIPKEITGEING